jgi:hypothetical protein
MIRTAKLDAPHPRTAIKRFTATLVATATALALMTAAAIPARADSGDIAKVIAGVATIAIIAKALEKDKAKAEPVHDPRPGNGHGYGHDRPRPGQGYGHQKPRPGHGYGRPPRQEAHAPRLPGVCAFTFDQGRRSNTVYSERCLRREGFEARLPAYCAQDIRLQGRRDRVYDAGCLIDAGFRTGRQRF